MNRLGLCFVGDYTFEEMVRYSRVAEKNGYESVWFSEDLGLRDAVTPLAAVSMATEKIRLGSAIFPIYYRPPALMAMTVATLDELSHGRFILGLGNGVRSYIEKQGLEFCLPLRTMEEYVEIVRKLLQGETVTYRGRMYDLTNVNLGFKVPRRKIPIYVAARGPRMFQLAGKLANGVIVSDGFCAEPYIRRAVELTRGSAESVGRDYSKFDFASYVLLSVSEDHDEAAEKVKRPVISLLAEGCFDHYLKDFGVTAQDIEPIRLAWEKGDNASAYAKVPDTLLDSCAVFGTPEECETKMKRLRTVGVKVPLIVPISTNF